MSSPSARAVGQLSQRDVERAFRRLADEWKSSTGPSSSAGQSAMHPAYQQIIGLGPAVIPCLLRELQTSLDHWFWALRAVTGEDPTPESARGGFEEMTQAWLEWGREHGYLPQPKS